MMNAHEGEGGGGGGGGGDAVVVVDDEGGGGEGAGTRKLSIDYMLEGESVKANPYLRAFAASGLPGVLKNDPHFFSWANIKGKVLRKEVAEASAAAARVPAAIANARRHRQHEIDQRCRDGDSSSSGGGGGGCGDTTTTTTTTSDDDGGGEDGEARAADVIGDGEGVVFFDLCSGKGFTSILLAHRYPKARVLMFDKNEKMNLRHLESASLAGRVTFHAADLYSHDTAALMRDAAALHGANGSAIVGVHLCGDLARRFQGITTGLTSGVLPDRDAVRQLAQEMDEVY